MRGVIALGLLLAFLPTAAAQISMEAPPGPIAPLREHASFPIRLETDCPPDAAANGIQVQFAVTRLPAWAQATIAPPTQHMDYAACAGARAVFHATATVGVTQDAPAFMPDTLEVTARVLSGPVTPVMTMRQSAQVTAAYFSILDGAPEYTQHAAAPREIVTFPLKISNFGNGNTKVSFEVGDHDPGVYPAGPAPLVLGSMQTGAVVGTSQVVLVQAYRVSNASGVSQFTIHWTSAYALDPKLVGDSGSATFRLAPRSDALPQGDASPPPDESTTPLEQLQRQLPAPSLPLALVPLAIAAVLFRRRRVKRDG